VRSVCEDQAGSTWVTTQNGLLARWQDAAWTTLSKETNWPGGHPSCVAADRRGAVWIGTRDRGLHRLAEGQYRTWRRRDGLASDNVRSLLASSTGDLWIATDGPTRVQMLHDDTVSSLELPTRLRTIRAMAEDAAGDIWMGTAGGQLFRVNGDLLVKETPNTSGRSMSIRCLYATPDGSLWIGYAGWGVGRLKAGKLQRITTEEGLNDDYISQMVADNRGWLWFAGNHGIFQVRLQELTEVAEGRLPRLRSVVYGRGEGLPNLQANYENFPGAVRGHDGRIWIAMRTRLAVIHADNLVENPEPPPVLLERVAVDGQVIALYDSRSPLRAQDPAALVDLRVAGPPLRLQPGHRKLEFEFAALSFTAPENVQFRHRLEGFDEDWVEDGTRRDAGYSRLPAGDYRFQVQACNNFGVWNQAGAVLAFVVTPFFWQTLWFRVTVLVSFTLSVIAVVRYVSFRRLHQQLRLLEQQAALHKERARIAKDIHDDLGANLTQISLLGELAQQDSGAPEKAVERTQQISATARQAIKSLDEIVWAVNPRNDTLAHLIDYAGQFALDYLRLAGIRCRLDFPEQTPQREVSTDLRHNLFLAVKEALHNIVKHAHASEVWLRVTATDSALHLAIEDNGCGFDRAPEDAWADGLRNMRQRLAEIGGTCRIESHTGAGTRVAFDLPWPRN
jgi:signal transduction histidine kinase